MVVYVRITYDSIIVNSITAKFDSETGFNDPRKVCCGYHESDAHICCGQTGIVNGTKVFGDIEHVKSVFK